MAELYSQYASGQQFTAGAIVGSTLGTSGLNPIVDRLNAIATGDNLIIGSVLSGTTLVIYSSGGDVGGAQTQLSAASGIEILNGSVIAGLKASTSVLGVSQFATTAQTSGTSTALAITPGGLNGTTISPNISGNSVNIWAGSANFATSMLIIENRTSDPANPAVGRMWLRSDL